MEAKGIAIIPMREYVQNKFKSRYQEWLTSLSPESNAILNNPLSSNWYPLKPALVEPTQKICALFHGGNERGAWELGRFSADHALKGIYSIFVKLGSPGFIVARGSRVITQYYRPCGLKIQENQPNRVVVQITEFPEPSRFVELRIAGWMERAIELSGKSATVKINKSMTGGDSLTEYEVAWK